MLAPWFDGSHALSDLGGTGRDSRLAFILGLILAGLLGLAYLPALRTLSESRVHDAGIVVTGIAVSGMISVGVFPTPHPVHLPAALALYLGITVLFPLWGLGEYVSGRRRRGLAVAAAGLSTCLHGSRGRLSLTVPPSPDSHSPNSSVRCCSRRGCVPPRDA